jgi:hypothetical protein
MFLLAFDPVDLCYKRAFFQWQQEIIETFLNKQVHHGNNVEEERSDSVAPYVIMASGLPHN